jgi:hypothetical protein
MDGHPGGITPRKLVDSMMMSWIDANRCENHAWWTHWLSPWGLNRYAANSAGIAVLAARAVLKSGHFQQVRRITAALYLGHRAFLRRWFRKDPPLRPAPQLACTLQESLVDSCAAAWTNKRANPNVLRTGRWWRAVQAERQVQR